MVPSDQVALMGQEIHGLSSAGKPWAGWVAQNATQECREACGGHGYLKASRFGDLRNDNDANCTYEGDNNVLLQQTSNWLLSAWREGRTGSPFGSLNFLKETSKWLHSSFDLTDYTNPYDILKIFQALNTHLLKATADKIKVCTMYVVNIVYYNLLSRRGL